MTINETSWHNMSVAFSGCGFLGLYHVGVAIAFRKFAPQCFAGRVSGASAGALAAAAIVCDLDLNESTIRVLEVAIKARENPFNSFSRHFKINDILIDLLTGLLPDDCHKKATDRLYIGVTQYDDWTNKLIHHYNSKADVIQAILCSCFIPVWSGSTIPTINGVKYIDGVFSSNLPVLDEHTITVSPFSGSSDICPLDRSEKFVEFDLSDTRIALTTENLYRMTCVLWAPKPEVLIKMLYQGFDDALRYMQKTNKMHCVRCMTVEASLSVNDIQSGSNEANTSGRDAVSPELSQESDSIIASESDVPISPVSVESAVGVNAKQDNTNTPSDISDEEIDNLSVTVRHILYHNPEMSWVSKIYRHVSIENFERLQHLISHTQTQAKNDVLEINREILRDIRQSLYRFVNFLYTFALKLFPFKWNSKPNVSSSREPIGSPRVSISCHLGINEYDYSNERNKSSAHYRTDYVSGLMSGAPVVPKPKLAIVKRAHHLPNPKHLKYESNGSDTDKIDAHLPKTDNLSQRNDSNSGQQMQSKPELLSRSFSFSQIECYSGQRFMEGVTRANTDQRRNSTDMTFNLSYSLNEKQANEKIRKTCETCDTKVKCAVDHMQCMCQTYADDITQIVLELEHDKMVNHHHNERATDIDDVIEFTQTHEAMLAFYYMNDHKEVMVTKLYDLEDNDSEDLLEEEDEAEEEPQPSTSGLTVSSSSSNTTPPEERKRKRSVYYPEGLEIIISGDTSKQN